MNLTEKKANLLKGFLSSLRFVNQNVLKDQLETFFLPFASSTLTNEEVKYFVKRFYRELNKQLNELPFKAFLEQEEVVKYAKQQDDYDSWTEWMILKVDSVEAAIKLLSDYDSSWVGELEITPREYDCTGETFSNGMKFKQLNENLVFAKKDYYLDA